MEDCVTRLASKLNGLLVWQACIVYVTKLWQSNCQVHVAAHSQNNHSKHHKGHGKSYPHISVYDPQFSEQIRQNARLSRSDKLFNGRGATEIDQKLQSSFIFCHACSDIRRYAHVQKCTQGRKRKCRNYDFEQQIICL